MTWGDLVLEYFPEATGEDVENILWSHTGYPDFWRIGADGNTPEECARKQLQELVVIVGLTGRLGSP